MRNTALRSFLESQVVNYDHGFEVLESPRRHRSPTMLKLEWLAERLRKTERLKKAIADGSYRIDSREVARAILFARKD